MLRRGGLDEPGLLQGGIGPIFRHRFYRPGRELDGHEFLQFRHPEPSSLEIGNKETRCICSDVTTDAALFLRHTAAVDYVPFRGTRVGDAADFRHRSELKGV